jgi:hypothetical protein
MPGLYDGATATNPQTGERVVYRISQGGKGRWQALSADTAVPEARERFTGLGNMSRIGERTLNHARDFVDLNGQAATGGLQDDPNLPEFIRGAMAPNAQRFRALSSQMVQDNWQPGTSGMLNTGVEQANASRRYPAPTNVGNVNRDVYLQMAEDVGVQQHAVQDMRTWLSQHPTLDGWDEHWGHIEPRLRGQIRQQATSAFNQRRSGGQPPAPQAVPAPGGASLRYNPATGQIE